MTVIFKLTHPMKLSSFARLALGLEHACEAEYLQGHNVIALHKKASPITKQIFCEI
jgi:hypothetical protein